MKNLNSNSGTLKIAYLFLTFLLIFTTKSFSQGYRNINAYVEDFGKNELYIKKAIIDYSKTIVDLQLVSRSNATSGKIIDKLNNINTIIEKNDKGFDGDTSLRDSFLKMNKKTIECLLNGSLILNDYSQMAQLSINEIDEKLTFKENNLVSYYSEVISYEVVKKEFGDKFKVNIRSNTNNNILDYNSKENFVFYKLNVADEKFMNAVTKNNIDEARQSLDYFNQACVDAYTKIDSYRSKVNDKSLNNANRSMIELTASYNNTLFSYFVQFNKMNTIKNDSNNIASNEYQTFLNNYNEVKNIYFKKYESIQSSKKNLIDNWYVTNSKFLKRNAQFEDYSTSFAQAD